MTAGTKQIRMREAAIAALLSRPTIAEAAKAAGIGEKSLRRWLRDDPEFQAEYREARQQALQVSIGQLQGLLSESVQALRRAVTCGQPGIEVRAAVNVFELAFRGAELLDLGQRVETLEKNPEDRQAS